MEIGPRTLISKSTSFPRMPKTVLSISTRGVLSNFNTLATARSASGSEPFRWRYWELKVSRVISSGVSLATDSTKIVPIGAGGCWGRADARSLRSTKRI